MSGFSASNRQQRRHGHRRSSMFFRMVLRGAMLRRGRAFTALLAMVVAAAATTAMLNLFVDVQSKLQKEFRKYGANIVLVSKDGKSFSSNDLARAKALLGGAGIAVPFGYAVAHLANGQPVVVSGVDLNQVRSLNSWWSVTAWPQRPDDALVGVNVAKAINPQEKSFDLTFDGHVIHVNPVGTLRTGAQEDSRIYLSLSDFTNWTGLGPMTIEIAAYGSAEDVNAEIRKLRAAFPNADVRPVRQVLETEARVLGKTKSTMLAASILIIATSALCVFATLMGWVLDRRRDFAILKALGASQRLIGGFFAVEAAGLGVLGSLVGFACGIAIAAWIGRSNFHSPVVPRFEVFPIILIGCVLVALMAALFPISLLRRLEPAMILKGE